MKKMLPGHEAVQLSDVLQKRPLLPTTSVGSEGTVRPVTCGMDQRSAERLLFAEVSQAPKTVALVYRSCLGLFWKGITVFLSKPDGGTDRPTRDL